MNKFGFEASDGHIWDETHEDKRDAAKAAQAHANRLGEIVQTYPMGNDGERDQAWNFIAHPQGSMWGDNVDSRYSDG